MKGYITCFSIIWIEKTCSCFYTIQAGSGRKGSSTIEVIDGDGSNDSVRDARTSVINRDSSNDSAENADSTVIDRDGSNDSVVTLDLHGSNDAAAGGGTSVSFELNESIQYLNHRKIYIWSWILMPNKQQIKWAYQICWLQKGSHRPRTSVTYVKRTDPLKHGVKDQLKVMWWAKLHDGVFFGEIRFKRIVLVSIRFRLVVVEQVRPAGKNLWRKTRCPDLSVPESKNPWRTTGRLNLSVTKSKNRRRETGRLNPAIPKSEG